MTGKVKLVNLTPHQLNIYDQTGQVVILSLPPPPEGTPIPRVSTRTEIVGTVSVDGIEIPVRRITYGDVENLPPPEEGTLYVVSTLVIIALKEKGIERKDLLSPDTNPDSSVRDSSGKVIGVKYLQTVF